MSRSNEVSGETEVFIAADASRRIKDDNGSKPEMSSPSLKQGVYQVQFTIWNML